MTKRPTPPPVNLFKKTAVLASNLAQTRPQPGERILPVALASIDPDPNQPRKRRNPDKQEEMSASIDAKGVLEPIILRPHPTVQGRYMVVCGERRFLGSLMAKKEDIPAVIRNYTDDEAFDIQVIENLQREDLNALDEVAALAAVVARRGLDEAVRIIGKKKSWLVKVCAVEQSTGLVQKVLDENLAQDVETLYSLTLLEQKDPAAARELVDRWADPAERTAQRAQVRDKLPVRSSKRKAKKAGARSKSRVFSVKSINRDGDQLVVTTQHGMLRFDQSLADKLQAL